MKKIQTSIKPSASETTVIVYWLLFIVYCQLSVVFSACSQIDDNRDAGGATIITTGDLLPAFTLFGSDGKQVTSASLNGRVFILNFFDTRCPDCQQEFSVLQEIHDHYTTTVPILNVPRSQSRDEVAAYWNEAVPPDRKSVV